MEEVEESYRKELEICEKVFLDNLKKGLDLKESEINYKKRTEKAREKYLKNVSKCLEKEGKKNLIKHSIGNKEKNEVFMSKHASCELNSIDKLKIWSNLFIFKLFFSTRNLVRKKIPNNILFFYYRIKIKFLRILHIFDGYLQYVRGKYEDLRIFMRDILKKVGYIKS